MLGEDFPAATRRPADADTRHAMERAVANAPLPDPQLASPARRTAFIAAVSQAWLATG